MTDLLTRLQDASEGSRELDCDIQEMDYRTGELDRSRYSNDQGPFFLNKFNTNWFEIPHYTTSIDAKLPGENIWYVTRQPDGLWVAAHDAGQVGSFTGRAKTEALARRIAALKAQQSTKAEVL